MNSTQTNIHHELLKRLDFNDIKEGSPQLLEHLKNYVDCSNNYLKTSFIQGKNVKELVKNRSKHLDKLLTTLWQHLKINKQASLIAVGGYGRGELHPHSDIDLLILSEETLDEKTKQHISQFIALLWDCGLQVGQSVRTLAECVELAQSDVTVTTNIMESRLLIGSQSLFAMLNQQTTPEKIWHEKEFFKAKVAEQKFRYKKFDSSTFDLEPNLKSSPGGLRDIHLVSWIAQRCYYPKTMPQLVKHNLITKKEYYTLIKCQLYIWQVRFALHLVANKAEDRLLFDHQKSVAKLMGFKNTKNSLAVEKMMKKYYQSALIIRNICDILLQVMEEKITKDDKVTKRFLIDDNFQIINQRIDITNKQLFIKDPSQLLKIFYYIAQDNNLIGITASTLRAIRAARYKINQSFRNKKSNKDLFMAFWHILHTSSRAIFLMKRSGVLADYLIPFEKITGQMQYDMFHIYTVDEHTLFLLKNLIDFADPQNDNDFPLCSKIMQQQKNPEIIFLAGLFHDIGKGRGGDHSEIGAKEANIFCHKHQLPPEHAEIIEWLVANHLSMSLIAQKRDITDPKVIQNFASIVQNQKKLDLLYILTVADIRATSHKLWNSWKDSLLKNLYLSTSSFLKEKTLPTGLTGKNHREKALKLLKEKNINQENIEQLWQYLHVSYFARRAAKTIAWQTENIIQQKPTHEIVVAIKTMPQKSGSKVFVYSKDKDHLFAALTATLSQQGLSIQAANIYTDKNHYCYDSFIVLDENGKALKGTLIKDQIKSAIRENIGNEKAMTLSVQKIMPRQFKYFSIETVVEFFDDEYTGLTRMELIARDQAGLLALVGQAFIKTETRLHDAKISTLGEKVEDTFIISHKNNKPITDLEKRQEIRQAIINLIDK